MAKHRARSLRASAIKGALMTAVIALLLAIVGTNSAGAVVAAGKTVQVKNSVVTGKCGFTFKSVNPSDNSAIIRLAAQAKPTSLAGYGTNAYTQTFCSVYTDADGQVAAYNPFVNGPVLSNSAVRFSVPWRDSYTLCAWSFVKLNDGSTSTTSFNCV